MKKVIAVVILLLTVTVVGMSPQDIPPGRRHAGKGQRRRAPTAGAGQVYLGIWANPELGGPACQSGPTQHDICQEIAISKREGSSSEGIGRNFALHLHYYDWGVIAQEASSGNFPDAELNGDLRSGRMPVISWKCDDRPIPQGKTNSDNRIAGNDPLETSTIKATAQALARYPGPVLLRWFWEFNAITRNQTCRDDSNGPNTTDFKNAWHQIRTIFQQAHATNVHFLWNPGDWNPEGKNSQDKAVDPTNFYPAEGDVDWIGLDTYQHKASKTFSENFDSFYQAYSIHQKPIIVGENGSKNSSINSGGKETQAAYLQSLVTYVQSGHPLLRGYDYFDSNGNFNWVLDDQGLLALAAVGKNPAFSALPSLNPKPKAPPSKCHGKQPCQF
ncbi:MAG TPA: hypothetical protein VJA94_04955 [Candidatus Angelobacter sp.]